METIKFSKKSFWFKYWKFVTLESTEWANLPKDTCSLRRDLIIFSVLAILCFPLVLSIKLLEKFKILEDLSKPIYIPIVMGQVFGVALGFATLPTATFIMGYLIGSLYIMLGAGLLLLLLAGIFYTISSIAEAAKKRSQRKKELLLEKGITPAKPMVVTLWNGLKDKVCSRIEYID